MAPQPRRHSASKPFAGATVINRQPTVTVTVTRRLLIDL
jgi:hypothetical protein